MRPTYQRKLSQEKPKECETLQFTPDSLDNLNASFDQTDWNPFINSAKNIDDLVDVTTAYINFNVNTIIPKKTIKQFPNNKPWINSELRKQVIEKHKAYSNNDPNYAKKQTEVYEAINKAKQSYKKKVKQMFNNNNMKDAWKGLKTITSQGTSKKPCPLTCPPRFAYRLHVFYSRFDNKDFSENIEAMKLKLTNDIRNEGPITISTQEVVKALKYIKTNKASGPDNISGLILKKCLSSLLYILHYISNQSVDLCTMPSLWKIGEIIPLSKKPLLKVDNDLRPVTLTALISKCFEKVILPKISACTSPFMDNLQFAYLPNRSTDDALITLLHELTQHLDHRSNFPRCLFIDYSSAFNTMQPHILIDRLAEYNVPA